MASRKEEKERLRQERMEREAAEQKAAERKKRVQLAGGGVLALAAVAAVVVAIVVGISGGGDSDPGTSTKVPDNSGGKAPTANISDLQQAAKQGKCELITDLKSEGRDHEDKDFTAADYKTNPPNSGAHNPTYPEDGIFEPGNEAKLGQMVHTLEHGRVWVQYKKGQTNPEVVSQLEGLLGEFGGYHLILSENMTNMKYQIAATAWTKVLGCNSTDPAAFDAIRLFYNQYKDKGPEIIP